MKSFSFITYKKQVLILRLLLIFTSFYGFIFFVNEFVEFYTLDYATFTKIWWSSAILIYLTVLVFIWFIWAKHPVDRNEKINRTLSIIILNVIGMWLWLPNNNELEKIRQKMEEE